MFALKPDFETSQKRVDAFWANDVLDRPLVSFTYKKKDAKGIPAHSHTTHTGYWLDVEYRAAEIETRLENTVFGADAMPVAFPNLGPEIVSAWAGCPYQFGANTTWSSPVILDWQTDNEKGVIDRNHPLFLKTVEFTKLLLERGRGKFIVGLTDFHPGGDHLAALRDPAELAVDLLENPEYVKQKLRRSYQEYFEVFDFFRSWLQAEDMPISTWLPLTARDSMYVPSCDFSCMVSAKQFEEFFLPGLIEEIRHYGKSIYHLDGRGALRHLDTLLQIKELNAVQWVPGAGHEEVTQWIPVFQKVLAAGKSAQISNVYPSDLPTLMEALPAKGIWLCMKGIEDEDTADTVMKTIEKWR